MVDFENALKRPFTDFKKLLIGILLSILPLVNLLSMGYYLEASGVSKKKINRKTLPEWGNWGKLLIKGFLSTVIGFIYFLPTLFLFVIGLSVAVVSLTEAFGTAQFLPDYSNKSWFLAIPSLLKLGPFLIVGGLVGLVTLYVLPIAILNYISSEKFSEAFGFKSVFKKALNSEYFVVWLVATVYYVIVYSILGFIPFVGMGIAFFLTGMFTYTAIGEIYHKL